MQEAKAPNLLFIFSDQHSRKISGCYGDQVVQTPNIDRLAAEGVRFDSAYCPSPICVPSRMSMLTSRWPHRQKCWVNDDMLRSDIPTWLHMAGAHGLPPTLIGRMHSIGPDQMRGYTERHIGDHSPNWEGAPRVGMGALAGSNNPTPESLQKVGPGLSAYQQKDKDVTAKAVDWLKTTGKEHNAAGQPFCLTVGYMLPHPPYVVDEDAFELYRGRVPKPALSKEAASHPFYEWWRENRGANEVTPENTDRAREAYWALVHRMDEMIGEVLTGLDQAGLSENTLVVYTSDHGDHLGERGLWWKHTFYEESAGVPLVMRLPGVLPAGESRSQVVNLIDLSQTMLEAMGAPALPNADGRSFWAVAKDESEPWINKTFSEYCTDAYPDWTGARAVQHRMLRWDDWKLMIYDNEPPQLFNLAEDPDELVNQAENPSVKEVFDTLYAHVTEDWSAELIAKDMFERRAEKDVIRKWAGTAKPKSTNIWQFEEGLNRLSNE